LKVICRIDQGKPFRPVQRITAGEFRVEVAAHDYWRPLLTAFSGAVRQKGNDFCYFIPYKARRGLEKKQVTMKRKVGRKMAGINVDKMSLKDINELESKLQKAKAQARDKARSDLKNKIEQILNGTGFTVADLFRVGRRGRGKSTIAKYANPDNRSETWTGRGRKPNWLVAKLNKGAKLSDFAL
jgi:DNA-binding protein H-NS